MSRRITCGGAIAVAAMVLAAGCASRDGEPPGIVMQPVGGLQMGVATSPNPPTTGENVMTFVLRDAGGKPLRGARVDVIVSMPAMGAMPYMESRGDVRETAAGVYRSRYGLSMAGDWDVRVRVQPQQGGDPSLSNWRLSTNVKDLSLVDGAGGSAGTPTPVAAGNDSASGHHASEVVTLDAARRQALGVRLEPVIERELALTIRAAGRVAYDETRRVDVTARFAGFVRAIPADFVGQPVRRGQTLFEIYSPELWAAQQEYLLALTAAREDSLRGSGSGAELAEAARQRLVLWNLDRADIDAMARTGRARETLPVRAPASGVVTEKNIVLGSPVSAGQVVYRIAPTDPVWVLANVYEQDLPWMKLGAEVRLAQPDGSGRLRHGRVSFISPELAPETRTGTVRIAVANADGQLKPGMYVDAFMEVNLGRRLSIPESAVMPTGERSIVFVDLGGGRLGPREVSLGARAGEWIEVRSGLAAGERVVTSGNFLVAAESRLRSASGKW